MGRHCCKVGAAVERYDLRPPGGADSVDAYLRDRWTGRDGGAAVGYRTLADRFNRHLLRSVYLDHDRSATGPRVESEYEALTGDDDLRRREVLDDLASDGIAAEALADALVSRSTMARHLKNCLGAEKPADGTESGGDGDGGWELDAVTHGRRAFRRSVADALGSLDGKGRLPGAEAAQVELPVLLSCPECATRVRLETALDRGYVCADHLGTR